MPKELENVQVNNFDQKVISEENEAKVITNTQVIASGTALSTRMTGYDEHNATDSHPASSHNRERSEVVHNI